MEYNLDIQYKDSVRFEIHPFETDNAENELANDDIKEENPFFDPGAKGVCEGVKYCRNCGNKLPAAAKFCDKCGNKTDY